MTDMSRGRGGTVGPPWSVDVLADLHAGVLDEQDAADLWPRVNADPEARAVIDALESTTSDLSGFAELDVTPMPADVAARIDAALERERQSLPPAAAPAPAPPQAPPAPQTPPPSNVVSLDAARARRNKRLGWGAGLLTAAAAVVAAVLVVVPGTGGEKGSENLAQPEPSSGAGSTPPLAVDSGNVSAAIGDISGVRDFGPLDNEARLDACLEANGVDPAVQPVGFRPVTVDGEDALVVLLTTGQKGQLRLMALAPDCGADNPGLLMDETVGHQG
ncbi:hypothetical protein [Saccharomonospora sp. NB11]|jgi:hypothetical protein|uniref:hypothetical protein n=1 Tax=Saccharomonospora sp. NB11 TaxID=1642298 RepID=UPI0018D08455|nr:hypothetical protein [Saccharomonospora sp. NB11]